MARDSEDPNADVQYHLEVGPDDVAGTTLLPGDPDRVETIAAEWDDADLVADHREYRTATGTVHGTPITATSTGIGSPSAAIAVEELARIGVDTFIRVGSCGTLRSDVAVGDLVITTGALRLEGTSDAYAPAGYPAVADHAVVGALIAAAEELGYDYHLGVTASTDSFYAGQGRPSVDGFVAPGSEGRLDELRALGVCNVEMEASAILTLASLFGRRAGAVCTVYANRETDEFTVTGERRAAAVASLATHSLERMDEVTREAGATSWHPWLSIE